ncbi:MAG TPA: DMT family transporter [Synergistaceae bacterium]|jgi:drug/metabolite transporter (DMT)-like permease|nr:DMT family transporter [Synergistaceae bacterium]HQF90557.1 DMT family transporter [Synergistaceae bacterium]HQH77863.1 DMT family transporter [Synergistaceae bacterium]HQK23907.1 DMT family transporter [Synergistaceae bacterium]
MSGRAYALALSAIGVWSSLAFLGLRLASVPPFLLVGLALLIGSGCSVHHFRQWRVSPKLLALGVYGLFGYHLCFFLALRLAPPVEANLMNYLWPLFTVIFSPWILPGYSLRPHHLGAAFLGMTGAALIVTGGSFVSFRSEFLPGYLLGGGAAFIWATYSLTTKRLGGFPNAAIGGFCFASGVLSLLVHVLLEEPYIPTLGELPSLVALGLGPMGGAFFLWDGALRQGDPRIIGSLAYLTPLLSTLLLTFSGRGEFTPIAAGAMGCILGGAFLGTWGTRGKGAPSP